MTLFRFACSGIAAVCIWGGHASTPVVAAEPVAVSGRAMGTTWTVKFLPLENGMRTVEIEHRIADRLEQLERIFSTYRPSSEIAKFNATGGTGWVSVSPELAAAAVQARQISERTRGAFDVTADPLIRMWGFGPEGRRSTLPTPQEIAATRLKVDWRQLEARTDSPALRRARAGVTADFSSIAKGYSADAVGRLLTDLGASTHFVQIGGDIKTGGTGPTGEGWRTGIETPAYARRAVARTVLLSGHALSTSGDYQNFIADRDKRFGHIINPLTGRPAGSELASVSVVDPSCATSSALATALFVLGPEDGWEVAVKEKLACLFFSREAKGSGFVQRPTPEFEKLISQAK